MSNLDPTQPHPEMEEQHEDTCPHYCSAYQGEPREFGPEVSNERARLILVNDKKWVNGTILKYYFFDKDNDGEYVYLNNGQRRWVTWKGNSSEKGV
ncbi:MAG: hypothetical protein AAFO07_24590, partial [Bacteroidota bacterium]